MSDIKQVPYQEPTNVRCHHKRFDHPVDLVPKISVPLTPDYMKNSYAMTGAVNAIRFL
jgi:hypothetical protein